MISRAVIKEDKQRKERCPHRAGQSDLQNLQEGRDSLSYFLSANKRVLLLLLLFFWTIRRLFRIQMQQIIK